MKAMSLVSFLLITLVACQQKFDVKADEEKLMQTSREWSQDASGKDIEKIVSYWADDAILMQPHAAPLRGKEAIRAMVQEGSKNPSFKISWEPIEAHISDDGSMGYLIEKNSVTVSDTLTLHHNVITVWRKAADGNWKNVADVSTPGEPGN